MKHKLNLLYSLLLILSINLHAQNNYQIKRAGGQGMVARSIDFQEASTSFTNPENFMKENFDIPPNQGVEIIEIIEDKLGFTHYRIRQTINNIPVDNSMYMIHVKDGNVISANGEWFSAVPAQIYAKSNPISEFQAFQKAKLEVKADKYVWEVAKVKKSGALEFMGEEISKKGKLVYITDQNSLDSKDLKLAYKFDIYASAPLQRFDVYIDANNGQTLFKEQKIHSADGTTNTGFYGQQNITVSQSGGRYVTSQTGTRNVAMKNMNGAAVNYQVEPVNSQLFSNNTTSFNFTGNNAYYMSAYWGMEKTWDMFNDVFGRSSYNGQGSQINLYVNGSGQQGDNNAFWAGTWTFFGNDTRTGGAPFTSLDVVGHEIAHGVTGTSANLVYAGQSGALNESFSDIFGTYVEYNTFNTLNDDVWTIGDKIALKRSMSNPNQYRQPDTYGGTHWIQTQGCSPSNQNDQCGVHVNSGVMNYWFYLTSQGGQGTNDNGNNYSVDGIGIEKAGQIAFRALTNYLTRNSDFAAARTAVINAASDLYGASSCEVKSVTNAMHAVGVGQASTINCNGGGGGGGSTEYCAANGNSTSDEYIGRVQLNTINNSSNAGTNGYSDHTSISTSLSKGSSYTITITPTWTGQPYSEGYGVWIDYNQDGDFTDAGEQVWTKAASETTPVSGNFDIPSTASEGSTRMRVIMRYNAIPSPCGSYNYGEVEDYTVSIGGSGGGGGADTQAPTVPTNLSSSNITDTSVTLSWTASTDNVGVTGYDVYQGNTNLGSVSSNSANINSLTANTSYQFSVRAKDAAGNISARSAQITVTTTGGSSGDPCAGVPPYVFGTSYQAGDRVTYAGNLYERTATSWILIGRCGSAFGLSSSTSQITQNELMIKQNPITNGKLELQSNMLITDEFAIFDISGKLLKRGTFSNTIDVSNLQEGMYIFKMNNLVKRFIVSYR